MRWMRMAGLGLAAAFALGCAASASAALPEFGHCVKENEHKGEYKYKSCLVLAEGKTGAYEWVPGPGANPGFKAESGTTVLETVGQTRIACGADLITGEYTGAKTATVTLDIKGCTNLRSGLDCQSNPNSKGEIVSPALDGEIGFISNGEKPVVGLDFKPKSGNSEVLMFTCELPPPSIATPEVWTIEGSVIGRIKPIDAAK